MHRGTIYLVILYNNYFGHVGKDIVPSSIMLSSSARKCGKLSIIFLYACFVAMLTSCELLLKLLVPK